MTKHLKNNLRKKGIGKGKIKEAIDNLTFSQLIKLTSNFVYPIRGNIKEALNKIDKIRKIRNKIVHEGKQLTKDDILSIRDSLEPIKIISRLKS